MDLKRDLDARYNSRYSIQVQAVPAVSKSGLTVVISPALKEVTNTITGETTTTTVATVSGEGMFNSFSITDNNDLLLLTATFQASDGYYFSKNSTGFPDVKFSGDDLIAGLSTDYKTSGWDKNGNANKVEAEVTFKPSRVDFKSQIKPIAIEFISTPDYVEVAEEVHGTRIIHTTSFPATCSNIAQNIELNIRADEDAQYKVTCTHSSRTNIVPDFIHKHIYSEEFGGGNALTKSVRIPIPKLTSGDLDWTITVVPESGTANGPDISVLTLKQYGLKSVTFTDNVTGINNTTFPDKVILLSHGLNANRSFYEVEDGDLNNSNRGWRQVDIVVTASSGDIDFKSAVPFNLTSFSSLNSLQIKDLKVALTTSSTAAISFKLKVPIITSNLTCSIKLSDFLTNV